jgi:hypothetical protein
VPTGGEEKLFRSDFPAKKGGLRVGWKCRGNDKAPLMSAKINLKCRRRSFDVAYQIIGALRLTNFNWSLLGISGKSQILFAVVYLSRYLDLFTTFISVYNTFMKFVFVVSSLGTLYMMYMKFRATYDHNHDSFRIEFLLVPCVILALLINHDFTVLEVSRIDDLVSWLW